MQTTATSSATECKTCGSEIVPTVNDSLFGEGECLGCEYRRYHSQPALLEALDYLLDQTVDQDLGFGIELTEGECDARKEALKALAIAHGNAA